MLQRNSKIGNFIYQSCPYSDAMNVRLPSVFLTERWAILMLVAKSDRGIEIDFEHLRMVGKVHIKDRIGESCYRLKLSEAVPNIIFCCT